MEDRTEDQFLGIRNFNVKKIGMNFFLLNSCEFPRCRVVIKASLLGCNHFMTRRFISNLSIGCQSRQLHCRISNSLSSTPKKSSLEILI
uniref:Uncharacterized protein n=1 Tax=Onchocerca volvulus TaxID=6282 RepID=A0A8R1XUD5_ONCVO